MAANPGFCYCVTKIPTASGTQFACGRALMVSSRAIQKHILIRISRKRSGFIFQSSRDGMDSKMILSCEQAQRPNRENHRLLQAIVALSWALYGRKMEKPERFGSLLEVRAA